MYSPSSAGKPVFIVMKSGSVTGVILRRSLLQFWQYRVIVLDTKFGVNWAQEVSGLKAAKKALSKQINVKLYPRAGE